MPDFGRWTSNGGDPSINEINRTDRYLDSLAYDQTVYSTDPSEAELASLLAGWRDEVRMPPLTAALTPRDAVLALDRATTSRRRSRGSLAVVGSLAAAVLCIGGFGAVVAGAGPGDPLYGLHTMLFGRQHDTREDAVVLAAQTQMAEVQQLIDKGQWDAAQSKLQTLTTTVASVNDTDRKSQLVGQWQQLTVKVETKDANATIPPGAPLPQLPDVPAVISESPTVTSPETTSPQAPTSGEPTAPLTPPSEAITPSTPPSEATTPSPTPSQPPTTPLPSPTTVPPSTTKAPAQVTPPSSSQVPQRTPSAVTSLPTTTTVGMPAPTTTVVLPAPTSTVVQQQESVAEQATPSQATTPATTVQTPNVETTRATAATTATTTTTVVVPKRAEGSN